MNPQRVARARALAILGIEDLGSLVSGLLESFDGLTVEEKHAIIKEAHEIADSLLAAAGTEARDWYMRAIGAVDAAPPPPRRSGSFTAVLEYRGRSKPIPDEEGDLGLAVLQLSAAALN